MTIRNIRIEGYRSIRELEMPLGQMNAVIGQNNSGKSNILKALNAVIGETWPTRPFSEKDIHGYRQNGTIAVTVMFDRELTCDPAVQGFRLTYSPREETEYVAVDMLGNPCAYGYGGRVKRVNRQMRDEVCLLYLDLDRQADKQIRVSQWTLYGKLLKRIEASIVEADRQLFTTAISAAVDTHIRSGLNAAQAVVDEFVRRQTGLDVRLDFELLHPVEVLKSVRPYVIDGGLRFDVEDVGAGVQSALAVAIAKAYADIVRQPLVLAIEEPELYLHPHGCRHFYTLLRSLSRAGLQIIYSTHERSFVNAGEYQEIHVVRKLRGETGVASGTALAPTGPLDRLRLQSKFNDRINEVFFASCVVLVEAEPDEIACEVALEKQGFELDKQSISIVALGGIEEIPVVAEVLVGLRIPTIALVDEDPGNPRTARVRAELERVLSVANVFQQAPNLEGLFALPGKPSRVDAMTIFPGWFSAPGNVMPIVYTNLGVRIRTLL